MLIIRRNTLSAGLQHLNWKFNVFVHREPTFTLLLLWRVIWAARYFWWPLLIGPIKTWDPLPIPFHSVPIKSGPTFNGIGKNRCPIDRHRCDPMPIFGRVPLYLLWKNEHCVYSRQNRQEHTARSGGGKEDCCWEGTYDSSLQLLLKANE